MKKAIVILCAAVVLVVCLSILAENPIVFGKSELSQGALEAVRSQSAGLYSRRLPLVPLFVTVDSVSGDRVYYTIRYFPLGAVEMSYSETDGYNCEKTLTRLQ